MKLSSGIDNEDSTNGGKESLTTLKCLLEFKEIHKAPIANIYVVPQQNNVTKWKGIIFPQSGYYKGGIFRFMIEFASNHPVTMPKVYFLDEIYHSLIDDKTFEINLRMMPEYHQRVNCSHLAQKILLFISQILNDCDFDETKIETIINNKNGSEYWNPARNHIFNRECQRLYCDFFVKKKQFINESKNENAFFSSNNYQFNESDHSFYTKVQYCVELSKQNNNPSNNSNNSNNNSQSDRKKNAFIQSLKRIRNSNDVKTLMNRTFG